MILRPRLRVFSLMPDADVIDRPCLLAISRKCGLAGLTY